VTRYAYEQGADWIFRINDDTEFCTRWAVPLTSALRALGPPYGVSGPRSSWQHRDVLIHDMTHRTHLDIFGHSYYDPYFPDWWLDDWISRVYGVHRTVHLSHVRVYHHTGSHGTRYQVTKILEDALPYVVRNGSQKIVNFMKNHSIYTPLMIENFIRDQYFLNSSPVK